MQAPVDSLNNKGAKLGMIAVVVAAVANFKTTATLALQGAGLLKFGWIFKSALTMVLSLAVYTFAFGWGFAGLFISLLLVHELGHWIWIKANKVDSTAPIFIPFVGAIIAMKKLPSEEATTAWIAFAGPLVGGAGALAVWLLGSALNNGALMSGGSFGFMLNLFQLVPAKPLDGGFVLGTVSRVFLIPGMILLFILAIATHSALLIIVCILSIGHFREDKEPYQPKQKTIGEHEAELLGKPAARPAAATPVKAGQKPGTIKQRLAIALAYFSLAGFLGYMQVFSFETIEQRFHTANPFAQLGLKIPSKSSNGTNDNHER